MAVQSKPQPRILTGALVGGMLAALLIALFFLGYRLLGMPFAPFDLLDWLARVLPGDVLTATIDAMVSAIVALNLGEISATAATIEQGMALVMVLLGGVILGALGFALLRSARAGSRLAIGVALGALGGIGLALISAAVNQSATVEPLLGQAWIVIVCTAWGAGLSWIYEDLSRLPVRSTEQEPEEVEGAPPIIAEQIDRRQFLIRMGGATATLTVLGAGVGLLANRDDAARVAQLSELEAELPDVAEPSVPLPNMDADLQPAPGTRPEYTPLEDHYRIDISVIPPRINADEYRLQVHGLVEEPLSISLDELINNYEPVDQFVTLSCISNPIGGSLISTTRWTGIPLIKLFEDWNLQPSASHLRIVGADSFDEYVELLLARRDERVMLCYAWDGQPLLEKHGFPLRIYIPNRYGMKQPKWITEIEVVNYAGEGYWVRRGWSEAALVQITSVIDTVAVEHAYERDGQTVIPVGGIAYSGARRISKVEVSVDDGDWVESQLREPLSDTTWVIWRYDWPFEPGQHTFRVRAYDGSDIRQIEARRDVRPDGATGWHSRRANVPDEL
jgi:DMSO/TMAO reductase YedYZ molybdopterin-dependent catalytic subunit